MPINLGAIKHRLLMIYMAIYMKKIFSTLVIYLITSTTSMASEIKPFTTDGCSVFPNGTFAQQSLWANCCISHDFAYWKGGTNQQRLEADKQLENCVANAGEPDIARIMLAGVRVGGSPHLYTPFRWGYGWPYTRGYGELTADEKIEINKKLKILKVMIDSLSRQLDSH